MIGNALLHALWTKAVDAPGYDKEQWKRLERTLDDLCSEAAERRVYIGHLEARIAELLCKAHREEIVKGCAVCFANDQAERREAIEEAHGCAPHDHAGAP